VIYVSPAGDDGGTGDIGSPLRTLQGARDRVRQMKEQCGLPPHGMLVYLRGGTYGLSEGVTFSEADSGSPHAPITYAAYPGEAPVLSGGISFGASAFTAAPEALSGRLPEAVRGEVLAVSLFDHGLTPDDLDYGSSEWQANEYPVKLAPYVGDAPLHMARWPNKVPGIYAENPVNEYLYVEDGGAWAQGGGHDTVAHPVFVASPEVAARMAGWGSLDDILLSGMLSYTYYHEQTSMRSFDPATGAIELDRNRSDCDRPTNMGKYYFENVLDELDAPGEYYIDRETGVLLFLPPAGVAPADVALMLPMLDDAFMVECKGASYLTFQGLAFSLGRRSAIYIAGGSHVTFDGCQVSCFSERGFQVGESTYEGWALAEYYGQHGVFPPDELGAEANGLCHAIANCDIVNTGWGSRITVGRVSTREGGHFRFVNNRVLHSGFLDYWGGVSADGVGIELLGNTVAFAPAFGLGLNAPDSTMAFNEVYDVISDPGQNDSSALALHHSGLSWNMTVRDNYVHDIQGSPAREWEVGSELVPNRLAIYVDGIGPGCVIYRNVVARAPQGMAIPDSPVWPQAYIDNLFVDVTVPIQSCQLAYLGDFDGRDPIETLSAPSPFGTEHYYTSGVCETAWRHVYPEFYEFFDYYVNDKANLAEPVGTICNNVCVNIGVALHVPLDPRHPWSPLPPEGAVVADHVYGCYENNRYLDHDPGFADYLGGDVQLSPEAAGRLGIEWVDLSLIGAHRVGDPAGITF
jgi:hypothetical protein